MGKVKGMEKFFFFPFSSWNVDVQICLTAANSGSWSSCTLAVFTVGFVSYKGPSYTAGMYTKEIDKQRVVIKAVQ